MKLENGFVKISGATDLEDSSMAAGMCALFNYPIEVDLNLYFKPDGMYQRCNNSVNTFSRDQTICLVSVLNKQFVSLDRVDGKDFFSPSDKGHIARCKGQQASWLQDTWFWAELYFSAKYKPLDELNQLFAKMMVADKRFIKWYCQANPQWRDSLRNYWCDWRDEKDFCEHIIKVIEKRAGILTIEEFNKNYIQQAALSILQKDL